MGIDRDDLITGRGKARGKTGFRESRKIRKGCEERSIERERVRGRQFKKRGYR